MKPLLTFLTALLLSSCATEEKETLNNQMLQPPLDVQSLPSDTDNWSSTTIQNNDESWGYQILNNGNLYINQPYIPAVAGNQGFKSEADASVTAAHVIHKLKAGFMPPSITVEELDSLKVLN